MSIFANANVNISCPQAPMWLCRCRKEEYLKLKNFDFINRKTTMLGEVFWKKCQKKALSVLQTATKTIIEYVGKFTAPYA